MTVTQWLTRGLSALVALALLLASLVALVEIVAAAVGRAPVVVRYPEWTAWLREHSWDDPVVRSVLVGLVLVGLLLVLLALRRGKPAAIPLHERTPGVNVKASRKSVERSLVAAASRTSGIAGAEASVRRGSARVDARTVGRTESDLREQVEAAVKGRLDSLSLERDLRLRVQVHAKGER